MQYNLWIFGYYFNDAFILGSVAYRGIDSSLSFAYSSNDAFGTDRNNTRVA
jgi:hypothetical protein